MHPLVPGLRDLVPILVALAVLATGQQILQDSDTGWHVRSGERILATGSVPREDPFSFSAAGRPWFAWEWLSDIGMALLHRSGGLGALVAASAVVLALSFALAQRLGLALGGAPLLTFGVTLLGATASMIHWLARPHLVSYLFATVFLGVLESGGPRRSPRLLLALPLLTLLWCNLHGAFPIGLVILGAYLLGALLPRAPRRWSPSRLGWTLAACCAVTILNPYGLELHRHLFQYVGQQTILGSIDEFRPPDFQSGLGRVLELWLLVSALALGPLVRARDWPRLFVLIGLTHMTLTSHRHIEFLVLCGTPLIAAAFGARTPGLRGARFDAVEAGRRAVLGPLAIGALALSILLWPGAWSRVEAYRFPEDRYPIQAAERLRQASARRILCTDSYGGYLIYCCWPALRVFVDGRSDFYVTTGVFDDYLAMLRDRPGWIERVERYGPDAVLLPREHHALRWLLQTGRWRPVYEDATAALLLPGPPSPETPRSGSK
jgi:hypothetical protein